MPEAVRRLRDLRPSLGPRTLLPSSARCGLTDIGFQRPDERFFHTVKVELFHQRQWDVRYEARGNLYAYTER